MLVEDATGLNFFKLFAGLIEIRDLRMLNGQPGYFCLPSFFFSVKRKYIFQRLLEYSS